LAFLLLEGYCGHQISIIERDVWLLLLLIMDLIPICLRNGLNYRIKVKMPTVIYMRCPVYFQIEITNYRHGMW
jgi:hypothetical protein